MTLTHPYPLTRGKYLILKCQCKCDKPHPARFKTGESWYCQRCGKNLAAHIDAGRYAVNEDRRLVDTQTGQVCD